MAGNAENKIEVVRMRVQQGRLVCDVWFKDPSFRYTTNAFLQRVLEVYPNLSRHACVNANGNTFRAVMNDTALPHLLEHLVIELQVRSTVTAPRHMSSYALNQASIRETSFGPVSHVSNDSDAHVGNVDSQNAISNNIFVGTSEWICEQEGRARIAVSFTDDLVALRAFQEATNFLNETVIRYAHDFSSSDI